MLLRWIRFLTDAYYVKGLFRVLWRSRRLLQSHSGIYGVAGGRRMRLDSSHYYQWMMASTGYYAFGIRAAMRRLLRPGDAFVDVGANIGYLSLFASGLVGPTGKVIAFEPDPRAARAFRENVAFNDARNSILVEKACAEREGAVTLNVAALLGWSTAVIDVSALKIQERIQVLQCTLDGACAELIPGRQPRLVKIDVEGFEPLVLAGARGLIGGGATAFLIEVNCDRLGASGRSIGDVCNPFTADRYTFHWIEEKRSWINSLERVAFERFERPDEHRDENGDILVVPRGAEWAFAMT